MLCNVMYCFGVRLFVLCRFVCMYACMPTWMIACRSVCCMYPCMHAFTLKFILICALITYRTMVQEVQALFDERSFWQKLPIPSRVIQPPKAFTPNAISWLEIKKLEIQWPLVQSAKKLRKSHQTIATAQRQTPDSIQRISLQLYMPETPKAWRPRKPDAPANSAQNPLKPLKLNISKPLTLTIVLPLVFILIIIPWA